jgi:dienelactone hydrolase
VPDTRSSAVLCGTVFAPLPGAYDGPLPVVVVVPGGGGKEDVKHPEARHLAASGYVALTVAPGGDNVGAFVRAPACRPEAGPAVRCPAFERGLAPDAADAVQAGIDFLLSDANPFAASVDRERVGAVGFSEGATAVSVAQEVDVRIDAVVAWDNLRSTRWGDDGTATCTSPYRAMRLVADIEITPRVPALGHGSDGTCNGDNPDAKKSAYDVWRAAGVPTAEVVHAGTSHTSFNGKDDALRRRVAHYTVAWFDRYVRHNPGLPPADSFLVADLHGTPSASYLSTRFRSALFLPESGVDCPDLRACTRATSATNGAGS